MKFHVMTLFPEMIENGLGTSILGRAAEKGVISYEAINMRDYTLDKHGKVDDYPYGGGAGMLIQAQPVFDAYKAITADLEQKPRTIYLTPQGRRFDQKMARELAKEKELVFLCGHYEGVDERVLEEIVTDYVSIGDYVLTGGELPVMVMIDAIARLIPGVLNNDVSAETETFHNDLLEYPQYTRPEVWQGKRVPEVLLSGNTKKVNAWRLEQSIEKTKERRPDLYVKYQQKQEIIKRLSKKKRQYIHMMELLNRGLGEVVYEKGMDILLRYENIYMLNAENEDSAKKLLQIIQKAEQKSCGKEACCDGDVTQVAHTPARFPQGILLIITQEFMKDILTEEFGMQGICKCAQAVFTRKEALPVRYKAIKQLDLSHLEYVKAHYTMADEGHLRERLIAGAMYGAFDEDNLIGSIGMHEEGSMGMLFVEEEYRRKGVGASLESYLINVQLTNGVTPYCHIIEGNKQSYALQEKLGLYLSDVPLWWMWQE
ncbi:MAG: tRNA (guanosine(37)-N1)-methyltransferase TrmD [Lachnospiraceae bacterium]|nr:tRNA (guanosine(37)-N1)-methyltransferase TrmD [Lachnospiraceae bacterium]